MESIAAVALRLTSAAVHNDPTLCHLDRSAAQWRDLRCGWCFMEMFSFRTKRSEGPRLQARTTISNCSPSCNSIGSSKQNRRMVFTLLQTRADNIPTHLRCDTRASSGKRARPARQTPCKRLHRKRNLICLRTLQRITPPPGARRPEAAKIFTPYCAATRSRERDRPHTGIR